MIKNFDTCPACDEKSFKIYLQEKLWHCQNEACRVAYFEYE
jgi:ribosomal protein L37AE/L43A